LPLALSIAGITAALNLLYFFNLIPPLPISYGGELRKLTVVPLAFFTLPDPSLSVAVNEKLGSKIATGTEDVGAVFPTTVPAGGVIRGRGYK
jgi:hypothetical protein